MTVLPRAARDRASALAQRDRHAARRLAGGPASPATRGISGDTSLGRASSDRQSSGKLPQDGITIELSKAQINKVVREAAEDDGLACARPGLKDREVPGLEREDGRPALLALAAARADGPRVLSAPTERPLGVRRRQSSLAWASAPPTATPRHSPRSACSSATQPRVAIGSLAASSLRRAADLRLCVSDADPQARLPPARTACQHGPSRKLPLGPTRRRDMSPVTRLSVTHHPGCDVSHQFLDARTPCSLPSRRCCTSAAVAPRPGASPKPRRVTLSPVIPIAHAPGNRFAPREASAPTRRECPANQSAGRRTTDAPASYTPRHRPQTPAAGNHRAGWRGRLWPADRGEGAGCLRDQSRDVLPILHEHRGLFSDRLPLPCRAPAGRGQSGPSGPRPRARHPQLARRHCPCSPGRGRAAHDTGSRRGPDGPARTRRPDRGHRAGHPRRPPRSPGHRPTAERTAGRGVQTHLDPSC